MILSHLRGLNEQVRSDLEKSQKLADDLAKQHTALLTKLQSSKVGKENSVRLQDGHVPKSHRAPVCIPDKGELPCRKAEAEKLKQVAELEQALQEKQQQLAQYSASDPQRYEALRKPLLCQDTSA